MNDHPEQLRAYEIPHGREAYGAPPASPLSRESAEAVFAARTEQLALLRPAIEPSLHDAICAKLEYEQAYLLKIVALGIEASASREKLDKVLPSEYFVQKRLDVNML